MFDMSGRWMLSSSIPPPYRDLIVPPKESWSDDRFFLPDQCYFPYRHREEAVDCLAGKQVSFLGDSLIEELATDLSLHMQNMTERPDMIAFMGESRQCVAENEKFR